MPIEGLQKQVISIPLQLGMDTKESPVLVQNNRFLDLQNVVFDRGSLGELHKRNGYSSLPDQFDINGDIIQGHNALAVFNDEQDLVTDTQFYAYGEEVSKFIPKGTISPIGVKENAIQKGSIDVQTPDFATLGGITVYAWVEQINATDETVFIKVVDEASGAVYVTRTELPYASPLGNPKVLSTGTDLVVLATSTAGYLFSYSVNPSSPQTIGAAVPLISGITVPGNAVFDACIANGQLIIALNRTSSTVVLYDFTLPGMSLSATQTITLTDPLFFTLTLTQCGAYVFLAVVSGNLPFRNLNSWFYTAPGLTLVLGPTSIYTTNPTLNIFIPRLTSVQTGGTQVTLFWELATYVEFGFIPYQFNQEQNTIMACTVDATSGATTPSSFLYGVSIASQPVVVSGRGLYLLTQFPSIVQATFFLQLITNASNVFGAQVVGKYFTLNAGPAPDGNYMLTGSTPPPYQGREPQPQLLGGTSYGFCVTDQITLESINDKTVVIDGLSEIVLNFTQKARSAQLGQNLHVATGSLLMGYDGSNLTEQGFNVYPEQPLVEFLTSQLAVIVDNQDATQATPQAVSIYIPDNGASPGGPVGQLITGGEYITFNGFSEQITGGSPPKPTAYLFWFSVDGNGTAPSGANFSAYAIKEISIASGWTAITIAQLVADTLTLWLTNTGGNYTVTFTPQINSGVYQPQRIVVTAKNQDWAVVQPALNRIFSIFQMYEGGSYDSSSALTCCPANLIQPGQFFYQGTANPLYAWFQIAGVGTDPNPSGNPLFGTKVILTGSETADEVAIAIVTAIGGTAFGPVVGFTSTTTVVPPSQYPYNPLIGGVEQGYVGANLNGTNEVAISVNYSAIYQWIDAQGQLHQSATAVPTTVYIPVYTTVGGTFPPPLTVIPPNAVLQIAIQNLTLSQKQGVDIEIYRTPSNPPTNPTAQVYYSVTNPPTILPNAPTDIFPTVFTDYSSDAGILSNQVMYTAGGVLDNEGPPACGFILNHQDRLVICDLEDPTLLWYSQEFQNGLGVSFSEALTIRVNSNVGTIVGGPITAAASMDGNLIVFQLNQPWVITGTGPDNTGTNGSYQLPQLITSNVGCRDPDSVVLQPIGLMFKSTQGIYLLNRAFQVSYIGAPMRAYNQDIVSSAKLVDNHAEIVFLSLSGTTLIYNFFYDSWGTYGNHNGYDSCLNPDGVYTYLDSFTNILQQLVAVYADDGAGYQMLVQTADLKFGGVSGYQRIWKFFLRGTFYAGQTYNVQVTYNEQNGPTDSWFFTPKTTVTRWRFDPSNQLCSSMQITFKDIAPYATANTPSLDAIDLEVGIRKGGTKIIGAAQSSG